MLKFRKFEESDWFCYAGVESDDPRIASVNIEGCGVGDCVAEDDMVGMYFVLDNGEVLSFVREFGRNDNDEFFQDLQIGRKFADWLSAEITENTTRWELTNRFGFQEI